MLAERVAELEQSHDAALCVAMVAIERLGGRLVFTAEDLEAAKTHRIKKSMTDNGEFVAELVIDEDSQVPPAESSPESIH